MKSDTTPLLCFQVMIYCDLHGHSRKQNVFMYGCNTDSTRHVNSFNPTHSFLRERLFPWLMAMKVRLRPTFTSACKSANLTLNRLGFSSWQPNVLARTRSCVILRLESYSDEIKWLCNNQQWLSVFPIYFYVIKWKEDFYVLRFSMWVFFISWYMWIYIRHVHTRIDRLPAILFISRKHLLWYNK